jgi:hypothetical protein
MFRYWKGALIYGLCMDILASAWTKEKGKEEACIKTKIITKCP